ncbi:hypothetical protein BLA29_008147 [Euroglyphus maynei]|uniref:Neogenin C-terminal domain-containing protein n=1 Tax=Euroglyphus maynei TaxID=6958 RepID=A0A1Y3ASC5_EURMA|nr:hypothetical protein BLA29_008147 [Euroglyphus maynei]
MKTHTINGSDVSINLLSLIIIIIFIFLLIIFLIAILKIFQSKNDKNNETMGKNRNGYLPTATSPSGKNINSRMNNIRNNNGTLEKPPDLWIHHNEQVEMKLMDKNNSDNDSNGGSVALSVKNNVEQPFAKIKKTNSTII